jgi:hypothetical protein
MLNFKRTINSLSVFNRRALWICRNSSSTASESEAKIEIPNYIERSPTSILRALSQTVGHDPTAAHFKYHDDPFLIPLSNIGKRTFALAEESGRKSAKWIRQEHSKLFQVILTNIQAIFF